MSDLMGFLLARLNEDAAAVKGLMEKSHGEAMSRDEFLADRTMRMWSGVDEITLAVVNRQIREVDAKRRIIANEQERVIEEGPLPQRTRDEIETEVMRLLALPYSDHPDYDEAWRP